MRRQIWTANVMLLALGLGAAAAPAPPPRAVSDKYLPDDTDFVLVVSVKDLVASPLYERHYKKKLRELLEQDAVPRWVKDLGTSLPRDVQRITIAAGRSNHATVEDINRAGPTIIVEGRMDSVKTAFEQLAKMVPDMKPIKVGDAACYEIGGMRAGPSGIAVFVDKDTLFIAPRKEQVEEALAKAAGTRRTRLKSEAMKELLGQLGPGGGAIQFVATKAMITSSSVRSTATAGGPSTTEVKHHTLQEEGIDSLKGNFLVGDDIRGQVTLRTNDEATAERLCKAAKEGLEMGKASLKREGAADKRMAGVLEALESVKVAQSGRSITFEGRGTHELIEGLGWFFVASRVPAPSRY